MRVIVKDCILKHHEIRSKGKKIRRTCDGCIFFETEQCDKLRRYADEISKRSDH